MFPGWALYPMVALSTVAAAIASQAVISGAFSITQQAIQLGYTPRLEVQHTSEKEIGQIYLPALNWLLLVGVMVFVLTFRTSEALAAAYGISVTGAMIVDSILAVIYVYKGWRWSLWLTILIALPCVGLESTFFLSNMTKFFHGGFVPVALAITISVLMFSWWRGTQLAMAAGHKQMVDLDSFARSMLKSSVHVVPGTAFFLTSDSNAVPPALLHNLKHNRVLHDRNIILTVETVRVPLVNERDRADYLPINDRFARLILRFGFMESPNVSRALGRARREGLKFDVMTTSFFLGRRKVVLGSRDGLGGILDRFFIALGRFSADPSEFYQLPRDRVVELGARISV